MSLLLFDVRLMYKSDPPRNRASALLGYRFGYMVPTFCLRLSYVAASFRDAHNKRKEQHDHDFRFDKLILLYYASAFALLVGVSIKADRIARLEKFAENEILSYHGKGWIDPMCHYCIL